MWIAVAALVGALIGTGGITALFRVRAQNRTDAVAASSVEKETLAKVTEAVQDVYSKTLVDLRTEVQRVVDREQDCRRRLADAEAELEHRGQEIDLLKLTVRDLQQTVETLQLEQRGADGTPGLG